MSNFNTAFISAIAIAIAAILIAVVFTAAKWLQISQKNAGTAKKKIPRRIRQPEAQGLTGSDPVENARWYMQMYDQNSSWFKLKFHTTYVVMGILGLLAAMIITSDKLQHLGVNPAWLLEAAGALGAAAHFFGWKHAWKNCRGSYKLLAKLVRNWDQNQAEYQENGTLKAERKKFAAEFDSILNGEHAAFLKVLEAQELRTPGNKPADPPPATEPERKE